MRITILVAAALLVVAAPPVDAANLVANGGFEAPVVSHAKGWNMYDSGTAGLGWTVAWYGGAPTYGGMTRPTTAHLELHRGVNGWSHAEGSQHAELDTDWDGPDGSLTGEPASVSIYQDLPTQNGIYTLSYAWSPRPSHGDNALEVWWDGVKVAEHSGGGSGSPVWSFETLSVSASAGTTQLEFREVGSPDSLGMFLDAVGVELDQLVCEDETAPLCAAQWMDLGTVTVANDDTNLYVTFQVDAPGWSLAETHVAVASSLDGIPHTSKGNPIPGQFPYSCGTLEPLQTACTAVVPLGAWCDGAPLVIAAHAAVIEVAGDGCDEQVFWATSVEAWDQGTCKNGTAVLADRSDPSAALGAPDDTFFSPGFDLLDDAVADAWLTVGFGAPVFNGPGDDLVVQEVTYGRAGYPLERAEMFGVEGGTDYFAGVVTNHDNATGLGSAALPMASSTVDFVKLLDATDPALHGGNADGYDVDAIGACYLFLGGETAWGDGCAGTELVADRGWATYFTYTVNACAPCAD